MRFGVNPKKYWLLLDLFAELADRRDLYSQAGFDGASLRVMALIYGGLYGLLGVAFALANPGLQLFFGVFLAMTVFMLAVSILPEAGNSLVNPTEAIVMAHQPVEGATYTAAKLTHLLKLVGYLVLMLNGIPAFAGIMLTGAGAFYPLAHLTAMWAAGLVVALLCCSGYGWLLWLVPPSRLRAAAQTLEFLPWIAITLPRFGDWRPAKADLENWFARHPDLLKGLFIAGALLGLVAFIAGLRALSLDYMVKVASIAKGGIERRGLARPSAAGGWIGSAFGGSPARAGWSYLLSLIRRDVQFRRQILVITGYSLGGLLAVILAGRANPFEGEFSATHMFPHLLGVFTLMCCYGLTTGAEPKAAWLFLTIPEERFNGFASGVRAALGWLLAVLPNLLITPLLIWQWGGRDALIFVAFSLAICGVYQAVGLRLIEGIPFARQPEPGQNALQLPVVVACGLVVGLVVAIQHYLLFPSRLVTTAAALSIAIAAVPLSTRSVRAFAETMRFHRATLAAETSSMFREVN